MSEAIAILSAARTPMAGMMGSLSSVTAPELGATAIKSALLKAGLDADGIDEVIMGCVLTAGMGQAPARQAALFAGINQSTPCTTLNKVCGSGMMSVMMAGNALRSGQSKSRVVWKV